VQEGSRKEVRVGRYAMLLGLQHWLNCMGRDLLNGKEFGQFWRSTYAKDRESHLATKIIPSLLLPTIKAKVEALSLIAQSVQILLGIFSCTKTVTTW